MHKKLTKNDRKLRKKYFKMVKKHQRNLDELNKAAHRSPWDSCFMLNYMAEFMDFMQDYYNQSWNLMQSEESLTNVQNTLKETIDAYYDWQTFEDNTSERMEEFNKIYREKRTKFFQLLADHVEEWWD